MLESDTAWQELATQSGFDGYLTPTIRRSLHGASTFSDGAETLYEDEAYQTSSPPLILHSPEQLPASPQWDDSHADEMDLDLDLGLDLDAPAAPFEDPMWEGERSDAQAILLAALESREIGEIEAALELAGAMTSEALDMAREMHRQYQSGMTRAILDMLQPDSSNSSNSSNATAMELPLADVPTTATAATTQIPRSTNATTTTVTTTTSTTATTTTTEATAATQAVPSATHSPPGFVELVDDDSLSPDDVLYREVRGGPVHGPAAGPPVIVKAPQKYNIALENVFPVRDPRFPKQVHPDYAEDNDPTRCHKAMRIGKIKLMPMKVLTKKGWVHADTAVELAKFLKHFKKPDIRDADELREAMLSAIERDLTATMKGKAPPSTEWVEVVDLKATQCDGEAEAQALVGRGGVVPKKYAPKHQPSIANGRIVGIFAGARIKTDEDDAAYAAAVGKQAETVSRDYGVSVPYGRTHVDWYPYYGGNLCQYLNTTFELSDTPNELVIDADKTNAVFVRVSIPMLTKSGKWRTEPMYVVVQIGPVKKGKQLKLDYGDGYTLTIEPLKIKEEPPRSD
ncbi:hypothetical protein [Hydrogenophaga sp.]|uniref:hypothetical protein n=1 Tax=Hydrogenophaga sp. TaxID=1904254 RepID=UPI002715CE13|nr:hypothetical protein [Hydrogenophaga sp.]MDO9437353.1 hypothetical protein [Hydrogenophaga sp.]